MICQTCRKAGELNQLANNSSNDKSEFGQKVAKEFHSQCQGGNWCDCQHVIGFVLNIRRIEGNNESTG